MGAEYRDIVQKHSKAKRGTRAILNVLANYATKDGIAHPGDERIAADAGVSTRTVRRQIQALVDLGEIQVLEGGNGRGNKREIYITLGNKTGQVDHFVGEEKPDSLSLKPDKLTDKTGQSVTVKPDKLTSSLYIEPIAIEPTTEPYEPPRAHAREEPPPKEQSQPEPHVKALVAKLHSVGVMTNAYITDKYMDLHEVDNIPFEYILRGITAAADNGKQHHFNYVATCIRNQAKGVTPEQLKKNTEQDETHRAIVTGRRGHAAADVDWKEINQLYSPFGVIDAIHQ